MNVENDIPIPGQEMKIESGIPIPRKRKKKAVSIYPCDKMKVRDSFYCPNDKPAMAAVALFNRKGNKRFISRKEGKGRRIWRIK